MSDVPYTSFPSKRYFRLLQAVGSSLGDNLPSLTIDEPRPTFTLTTYSLDEDVPPYVALSYTWGPPFDIPEIIEQYGSAHDRTISISHGGGPFREQKIGRNLFEALIQTHLIQWQGPIWADAVCINQKNISERGEQVQLMGEIYSRPEYVVSWLGMDNAHLPMVDIQWCYGPLRTRLIERGSRQVLVGPNARPDVRLDWTQGEVGKYTMMKDTDLVISEDKFITLYRWFTTTRYFQRMWIFQELVLPRVTVSLFGSKALCISSDESMMYNCGDHHILYDWVDRNRHLLDKAAYGDTLGAAILRRPQDRHLNDMKKSLQSLQQRDLVRQSEDSSLAAGTCWNGSGSIIMETLLHFSASLEAFDPRDKIYALLGIASRYAPDWKTIPTVEYLIDRNEQAMSLTAQLLVEGQSVRLFFMKAKHSHGVLKGLPSWVIDTRSECSTQSLAAFMKRDCTAHTNSCDLDVPDLKVIGHSLHLSGHFVSQIKGTSSEGKHDSDCCECGSNHLGIGEFRRCELAIWILEMGAELGPQYRSSGQPIFDAIVDTTSRGDSTDLISSHWKLQKMIFVGLLRLSQTSKDPTVENWTKHQLKRYQRVIKTLASQGQVPAWLAWMDSVAEQGDSYDFDHCGPHCLTKPERDEGRHYSDLMDSALLHRHLFRAETGHIGHTDDDVKPDDQIWIPCKGSFPIVLRRVSAESFTLIGEAYIHGGMHGELFEEGIAGPLQNIKIV